MTNNIDPWELLREAREYVDPFDAFMHDVTVCKCQHCELARRIDAALAAHEAEMIEHRKNFARDCKDFDRTMAAWKNG